MDLSPFFTPVGVAVALNSVFGVSGGGAPPAPPPLTSPLTSALTGAAIGVRTLVAGISGLMVIDLLLDQFKPVDLTNPRGA